VVPSSQQNFLPFGVYNLINMQQNCTDQKNLQDLS